MYTFQDFETAVSKGTLIKFLRDAINDHRGSEEFRIAKIADEYDAQRNTTINEFVRKLYSTNGTAHIDFTASNNRIASNFYRRLNRQRCTYSLGNGVTFDEDGIKEKLGERFDTDLFLLAYKALEHGSSFGFWNMDRLYVFPLTEFVPLYDETDGTLRAGIRYWSIDWDKRPVSAVLYEEDGYTKYRTKDSKGSLNFEEIEPKRGYRQTIQHTDAGGDEVIAEDNYAALPIQPLYGNAQRQSTLVGMRAAIDSFDLIQSGFANDLNDCAQVYWILGNALGMDDADVQKFMDRLKLNHVAVADTDNSSVTPYTQELPYAAREAYLNRIMNSIYRDFGAFNPEQVAAGQITATQINAAYQPMDEEADAFEYQVIEFMHRLLGLMGITATPTFKRNRVSNQLEQVQMVMMEAQYLDDETLLNKLPNITVDEIPEILERKGLENQNRFNIEDEEETVTEAP